MKITMQKMKKHLISFGDDILYKYQKLRLRKEAESTNWFDDIIIHSPDTIKEFLDEHKNFVNNSRGWGYWIWKPYIILNQLSKIDEGDFLFYIDSGGSILNHKEDRLAEYLNILNSSDKPVITFCCQGDPPWYQEKKLQKMRVLKRFNLDNNEEFLNSGQIEAGVFICKKSEFTINFVKEWLELVIENNYNLVNDEDDLEQSSEFLAHRHDQSVLSILSKLKNVTMLNLSECYGVGPFFSSRITDNGARENAPDSFRKEPDYDAHKHHTWKVYLSDAEVIENTIKSIKNIIKNINKEIIFFDIDKDIKSQFLDIINYKLEKIQFNKGLFKIKITFDETRFYESVNKEKLIGEFYCEFIKDDSYNFNFIITKDETSFPEIKPNEKMLYKTEYIRTWDLKID